MTKQAVVIGAGIAGLCAARVLADHFDQVTLIDRDGLPSTPEPRRGVPQGGHGHILLGAGQRALTRLFPGLMEELYGSGAVPFEPGLDLLVHRFGHVWSRVDTGLSLVSMSRPLLEWTIAQRVQAMARVTVRSGVAVSALVDSGGQVGGVRLDTGEEILAALVVDATGRGGRSDRWLSDLGFPTPEVVEVKIRVGYATMLMRRVPDGGPLEEGKALFVIPTAPDAKRAGVLLPIEGDRWMVTLGGWHGEYPSTPEEFEQHARDLPHPAIKNLLADGERLTEPVFFTFPASRRRYFEKLDRVPSGYLAVGDAMCSFNPIYGQGMSCAAMEAEALSQLLARSTATDAAFARRFYRRAAKILATPWSFAVGGDFAFPETTGPRPKGNALLNAYSRRMQIAAQRDSTVRRVFNQVQHLLVSPTALFRPSVIFRVMRASRGA